MKRSIVSILVALACLGGILPIMPPAPVQASSAQGMIQSDTSRPGEGRPDNDHTPIYGPNGELLYPIYSQQRPFFFMTLAAVEGGRPCDLPRPVADGRYGDLLRTDNWARTKVASCDGRLVGVAWSAWPGRNPIDTDHDRQDLWVKARVTDLTTGRVVDSLDLHLTNNPREQGVLYYVYEFEMPANGHRYALWMWAKVRQQGCNNGSGDARAEVQATAPPPAPLCESLELSIPAGREISEEGVPIDIAVNALHSQLYRLVSRHGDEVEVVAGPQSEDRFKDVLVFPGVSYQVQVRKNDLEWTVAGCEFSYRTAPHLTDPSEVAEACVLVAHPLADGATLVELSAIDRSGEPAAIDAWRAESNFGFVYAGPASPDLLPIPVRLPNTPGRYWVQFEVQLGESWLGEEACRIEHKAVAREQFPYGQYQDFVGAAAFGTFTPYLEPGKEYFDSTQSLMYNAEYVDEEGRAEIVFRFNGQEVSGVTTSLFNAGSFRQVESVDGRALTILDRDVTKLIAYRYEIEQARSFQTVSSTGVRWIHPLDQPFEHKYEFDLQIYGPPGVTDMLVYHDHRQEITYDDSGRVVVPLQYTWPGLVAIYQTAETTGEVNWIAADLVTYPITSSQAVSYEFGETGLYHYRIVDSRGQVVAGPSSNPRFEFMAAPGVVYRAELVYPETSVFVGLYDDMRFKHPAYWLIPVDAAVESVFEFHLDYHRNTQGDVVVDQLYLLNAGISAAQAFPYGRHDAVLPGVKIVGIPDVSMVAFCQPPGVHAVAYWGDWEGGSYTLPDRYVIFDQELYEEWSEGRRGDCIDAAHRVNMEFARQGLRTDHTYRHHGERSQGYQMSQLYVWSPYNLVGLRPPHVGSFLKPGTILPYYSDVDDLLFWGWDLDKGHVADGLSTTELRRYIESLGPIEYVDQTGLHPPRN